MAQPLLCPGSHGTHPPSWDILRVRPALRCFLRSPPRLGRGVAIPSMLFDDFEAGVRTGLRFVVAFLEDSWKKELRGVGRWEWGAGETPQS